MLKIIDSPDLPKEIFKTEVSPQLLAQAVRVYLANQRQGNQSALTRAEVNRTRKKIFKQKGTGHARHGDRKAPIFVGGGVAFAPKPRDYSLSLTNKMRTMARLGAMSAKNSDKSLFVVDGLDKLTGKTKEFASFIDSVAEKTISEKQNSDKGARKWKWLVITDGNRDNVVRASRNIDNLEIAPANLVNTYQIIKADRVIVMPEAVNAFATGEDSAASKVAKAVKVKEVQDAKSEKPVIAKPVKVMNVKPVKKATVKKAVIKKTVVKKVK